MELNRSIHTLEDVHMYDIKDTDGKSYPIVGIDFSDIQSGEDRYHYALRKYNEAVGTSAD